MWTLIWNTLQYVKFISLHSYNVLHTESLCVYNAELALPICLFGNNCSVAEIASEFGEEPSGDELANGECERDKEISDWDLRLSFSQIGPKNVLQLITNQTWNVNQTSIE